MMHTEKIMLLEGREDAFLETYVRPQFAGKKRPAMLVIPGGGYGNICDNREGEPIALVYLAEGYNCFVLHYPVAPNCVSDGGESLPLIVASKAVAHIRRNADKYFIDPEKIAAVGFSAGGHLAASLATMWHYDFIEDEAGIEYGENKVAAAILSYPVISSDPAFAHLGSINNLLKGGEDTPEKREFYSCEKQVSDKTPPLFIWHTATDTVVPVRNSIEMAKAMSAAKLPFELHIYPEGNHGLATCKDDEFDCPRLPASYHCERWMSDSVKWLETVFKSKGDKK